MTTSATGSGKRGLLLSLLLGFALLVCNIWWAFHYIVTALADSMVTMGLPLEQFWGPVFLPRVVWFVAALLVVHLGFGLFAFSLSRLTAGALPRFAAGREYRLVLIWFAVLFIWALVVNASWYPASRFAPEGRWLLDSRPGIAPWQILTAVLSSTILALTAVAAFRQLRSPRKFTFISSAAIVVMAALLLFGQTPTQATTTPSSFRQPHIVIIGIDSLRDDFSEGGDDRKAPHLEQFLNGAHQFTDTITPFARTYPSWLSILTGRHPVTTNARDNLMPRTMVQESDTLGDALIAHGYRSVYATDEVRFANFDESFGFDQMITPQVGASDFILGKSGDLPLHNLLINTPAGAWLFPANYANRAAYVTYRPEQFVARLERELSIDGPSFLSIHLTLAHWPYSWAGMPIPGAVNEYRVASARAVEEVDRQFADVLTLLEKKGVLENAVVVLLSDHGEALGGHTDSMLRKTGTGPEIWNSIWGHGTSVMSPHQYSVVFGIRAFGRASLPGTPESHAWPVSLEDVRPTLQEIATGQAPVNVDGRSLLSYLADPGTESQLDSRIRFTETGFSPNRILAGHFGSEGLIREGIAYFEIVPGSGWLQLRADKLALLKSQKQRAALSRDSLLAAIPSWTDDSFTYLFTDRRSPMPRRLEGRPNPKAEPEAARLWDALHARFPGELGGVGDLP